MLVMIKAILYEGAVAFPLVFPLATSFCIEFRLVWCFSFCVLLANTFDSISLYLIYTGIRIILSCAMSGPFDPRAMLVLLLHRDNILTYAQLPPPCRYAVCMAWPGLAGVTLPSPYILTRQRRGLHTRKLLCHVKRWRIAGTPSLVRPSTTAAAGGSVGLDVPHASRHYIKPPSVMLSGQMLFCFL